MTRLIHADDASAWLVGMGEIAAFLGLSTWTVRTLVQHHGLPVGRLGRQLCTRKGVLLAWVREFDDPEDRPVPGHAGGRA